MSQTNQIQQFLKSNTFLLLCLLLILIGLGGYVVNSITGFNADIGKQNEILEAINTNQNSLEQQNIKITELTDKVSVLEGTVCTLQKQIESLGAIPAVEKDRSCE